MDSIFENAFFLAGFKLFWDRNVHRNELVHHYILKIKFQFVKEKPAIVAGFSLHILNLLTIQIVSLLP